MAVVRTAVVVALVAALGAGALFARGAIQVTVGYSAKQLCSGVFVAGLPQAFIAERDVLPRMAILGPAIDWLELSVDDDTGLAAAEFLGMRAQAVHRTGRGCALHGELPGDPALPAVATEAGPAPVPEALTAAFDRAFAEPDSGAGRNTLAVLVAHRGAVIAERYAAPVQAGTRLQGWSMNKSLMATWVGLQAARGELEPGLPIVDEIRAADPALTVDPSLTLLHLLQMESGLDFTELYGPGSDVTRMLYRSEAMWRVPASRPAARDPGAYFYYSSGDTVLASFIWQQSLAMPYERWVEERFSAPLGLRSLVAEADASGVQVGSSYIYMTGRDWLRVGQLWLDAWHGRSPLLDAAWLRDSVQARPSDGQDGRYGRGFWLNTGGIAFPGLPENLFFASGNSGQSVVVIPDWELVVVRLGLTASRVSAGTAELLTALTDSLELRP